MTVRVLTWNLFHGRAVPPAGRPLLDEFAARLAAWEWDIALLQEVPPWWPEPLAHRAGADYRDVLTSRNGMLPLRRAVAERAPDLIKSNGGGANAILVRGARITETRVRRLCRRPERRWLHAVRTADGVWFANLHLSTDTTAAAREATAAGGSVRSWANGAPIVLGGDFNLRPPTLEGYARVGGNDVDHVFCTQGASPVGAEVLERGELSDHAPVTAELLLPDPGRVEQQR